MYLCSDGRCGTPKFGLTCVDVNSGSESRKREPQRFYWDVEWYENRRRVGFGRTWGGMKTGGGLGSAGTWGGMKTGGVRQGHGMV